MTIYREVRARHTNLPILVYSATTDRDIIDIFSRDANATYLGKWATPTLSELSSRVQKILGLEEYAPPLKAFIVHGHDDKAKLEVKNYLQNTLQIVDPIILHEQPNLGRTIIEKFEDYSADAKLAFVILTPDDKVVSADETNDEKRRARQNVVFELGYFLGTLGRSSGRVVLLHKGPIELPSDVTGLIYIDVSPESLIRLSVISISGAKTRSFHVNAIPKRERSSMTRYGRFETFSNFEIRARLNKSKNFVMSCFYSHPKNTAEIIHNGKKARLFPYRTTRGCPGRECVAGFEALTQPSIAVKSG
ncbi:MAG: hypothetical protein BMS9Abin08_1792 [Gammaproteobacteria bacterium]|nr:MAG: hypothetical protein BMS9Abin08_1792 [Gammaproteobacteria bacterium]